MPSQMNQHQPLRKSLNLGYWFASHSLTIKAPDAWLKDRLVYYFGLGRSDRETAEYIREDVEKDRDMAGKYSIRYVHINV
jgi:hypothetical protein